jgi:uncharacterized protein YraI
MIRSVILALLLVCVASGCTLLPTDDASAPAISGAPVVALISPQPNAIYLENIPVNIQASISNAGADIAFVEFKVDDAVVHSVETPNTAAAAVFSSTFRWTASGVGEHTITVSAFRADGTNGEGSVTVNVRSSATATPTLTVTPTPTTPAPTSEPTEEAAEPMQEAQDVVEAPTATEEAQPAASPVPPTSSVPTVSPAGQGVNVRTGPSQLFATFPGGLGAGQSAEVVATNLDRTWYKIRYGSGFGWVFSGVVTLSGDISSLPAEAGPPPPTAVPPTATSAVVATSPPVVSGCAPSTGGLDLCIDPFNFAQTPFCGVPANITVTLRNVGSAATSTGFFVIADIVGPNVPASPASGSIQLVQTVTQSIAPGASTSLNLGSITQVRTGGQVYTLTLSIGLNGMTDVNTANNTRTVSYTLSGTCQ